MSGVPCCLVEVFLLNKKLAAISYRLLWVVEVCIRFCTILYILTKPKAVALVFLLALVLGTVHHVFVVDWHN